MWQPLSRIRHNGPKRMWTCEQSEQTAYWIRNWMVLLCSVTWKWKRNKKMFEKEMILIRIKRHAKRKGRLVHHRLDYDRCGQWTQNSVYARDATMQTGGSTHTHARCENWNNSKNDRIFFSFCTRTFAPKTHAFTSHSLWSQWRIFCFFVRKLNFLPCFAHAQHKIRPRRI